MKTTKRMPEKRSSSGRTTAKSMSERADSHSMLLEFFTDEVKDIYWAEKHLTKALPKMAKSATSESLRDAFEKHLNQTEEHVSRLEQVFELLDKKPQAKKCDAMAGLVEEGQSIIDDTEKGSATRDVGLIMAAQKVEHYEIATYGGLVQLAKTLGKEDIMNILAQTLSEEKEADHRLTQIAESHTNYESAMERE